MDTFCGACRIFVAGFVGTRQGLINILELSWDAHLVGLVVAVREPLRESLRGQP